MWLSRILIFIIFFIVVGLIRSFLVKVLNPVSQNSKSGTKQPSSGRKTVSGQMVKDPQCGMYVAKDLALTLKARGETFHFCSKECRDFFAEESRQ